MTDQVLKNKRLTLTNPIDLARRLDDFAYFAAKEHYDSSSVRVNTSIACRACVEFTLRQFRVNKREIDGIIDEALLLMAESKQRKNKAPRGITVSFTSTLESRLRVEELVYLANKERIASFAVKVNSSVIHRACVEFTLRHVRANKKEIDGIIDELLHAISDAKRGKSATAC